MSRASHRIVWFIARAVLVAAFFGLWYQVYALLNARGSTLCVCWASPNLYVKAAVPVYVFGGILVGVAPFLVHREPRPFFRMLWVYAAVSTVFFAIYFLYPVCMIRRSYAGADLADRLMRVVVGLDQPANCFPSSHCMFATLGYLGTRRGGASRVFATLIGLVGAAVCASTVLVGQHYLADVVVGIALSAVLFQLLYRGAEHAEQARLGETPGSTVNPRWQVPIESTGADRSRLPGLEWETVRGGMVPVFRADGSEGQIEVQSHPVPTLDVRGRDVLFLSDLHLFCDRLSVSVARLRALRELITLPHGSVIILGGDIFEVRVTSGSRILAAVAEGCRPRAGRSKRALVELFTELERAGTVLLSGNHDPWRLCTAGSLASTLAALRAGSVRLVTARGTWLAAHGHQVFVDHDQVTWGGIRRIRPSLIRLFFYYEALGYTLAGQAFLRLMYAHINRAFRAATPALKSAFEVDAVLLGHSHLPLIDPELGLYVTGISQHGQLSAIRLDTDGHASELVVRYNATARWSHALRFRLGVDRRSGPKSDQEEDAPRKSSLTGGHP